VVLLVKDLITNDDPDVEACTAAGVSHDYRIYHRPPRYPGAEPTDHLRCVWCHAVSCGDPDDTDPCLEPYHHHGDHRTGLGVTWPKGGTRPGPHP
jgi:hypothetical protein